MKRILKSPIAVWCYILFAFTAGGFYGASVAHKEFMSWDIKSDREYIAFEVKRMAEERPILDMRIEQLIKEFEKYQYTVEQIRLFRKGQAVNIVLEEQE